MINPIIKKKITTLSIDLDVVTVSEMVAILHQHDGYIDGDRRT